MERCRLDVYYPDNRTGFATLVWFHGGGLKGGNRSIPRQLRSKGIAVVGVNYRLYPKVKCPGYLQDAAAAVAWTFRNIEKYGGDPNKIFVTGHSAGGYLTSMIGIDKRWLAECGIDADQIAGLIPLSGHTITHMTVREERGSRKSNRSSTSSPRCTMSGLTRHRSSSSPATARWRCWAATKRTPTSCGC